MNERQEEYIFREGFRRGYEKGKADRPRGEWCGTVCSNCGESTSFYYDCNFCPNCGADMRGEDDEVR